MSGLPEVDNQEVIQSPVWHFLMNFTKVLPLFMVHLLELLQNEFEM